ncbi:MAG: ABC transporter substrate-binding protein [Firmicutes bacterium]|nr:ABC transporter substrate-binding protein [Bacillota bacterium]
MSKGKLFLTLVVITVIISAIALPLGKGLKERKIITLTVAEDEKSLLHLPLYLALQQGYFADQGVRVRLTTGSDSADVTLLDPAAYLYEQARQPAGPVIAATVADYEGTFLLARDKKPFTWSSLRGKKIISYPPESGPALALDKQLRANGLAPFHNVILYHRIPPDLRLGTFKAGSGDYIQLSGVQALTAERDGMGYIATAVGTGDKTFPAVLCAVSRTAIAKHPEAVQKFINCIYQAQLYLSKEPQLALPTVRSLAGAKEQPLLEALYAKYSAMGMWQPKPELDQTTFAALTQAMETAGQLPAPVQFDCAVNNEFTVRAAETVRYSPPEERQKNRLQKILDAIIK